MTKKLDEAENPLRIERDPLESSRDRRDYLLGLLETLHTEGINSIGDLEIKIARLNEELK